MIAAEQEENGGYMTTHFDFSLAIPCFDSVFSIGCRDNCLQRGKGDINCVASKTQAA